MAGPALSLLRFLCFLPVLVRAANDWSKPCFEGQCSYDISGPVSGSLLISGNSTAISDITGAAGWQILDCDPDATLQNIRAVCTNATAGCDHLYQGGAVGTIVRLPENCTQMAFARVAAIWEHENQTTSNSRRSRIFSRAPSSPVMGMALDSNFSAINASQSGNTIFSIIASSFSVENPDPSVLVARDAISTNLSKTVTENIPPINVAKQATIFNESSQICATKVDEVSASCSVQIAAEIDANIVASYSVSIAGSLVPPQLTQFALDTGLNGSIGGSLIVNSTAGVTVSTGSIPLFQIGIPGLDIPGILSIGPTFQVDVEATATLGVEFDAVVAIDFSANNAKLSFPQSSYDTSSSSEQFTPGQTGLQLWTDPKISADTEITVSLIPSIAFGISAFDDVTKATVSLDLDVFATLDLSAQDEIPISSNCHPSATSNNSGVTGCVEILGGVNVTADADASFFDLFDADQSVTLFSKTLQLFQKCFS